MYTGVPGVGTSVWKNAAMSIGIRTQPWEAVPAGAGYVADQRDMVASVEDENLILQVDLDPQATAMGDQDLGRPRAGQGPLHRGADGIPRVQALRLLERPYGLKGV